MLARLVLRNLVTGLSRGVFVIVAVVAALLINGTYTSYAQRSQLQSRYLPGQARMAIISPRTNPAVTEADIRGIPGVAATLSFKAVNWSLGSREFAVWAYEFGAGSGGQSLIPEPVEGTQPTLGECLIPSSVFRSMDINVGDTLSFRAGWGGSPRSLVVAGVVDDPLWTALLAPVGDLGAEEGALRIAARLVPGTNLSRWLRDFDRLDLGEAVSMAEAARPKSDGDLSDRLLARLTNLILIVAAFVAANSTALSLVERSAEVALLRALGVGSREIVIMYVSETSVLTGAGVALAYVAALAATAFLPALAGEGLPATVLKGGFVAFAVAAAGCLAIMGTWHSGSPMHLLRKRGA